MIAEHMDEAYRAQRARGRVRRDRGRAPVRPVIGVDLPGKPELARSPSPSLRRERLAARWDSMPWDQQWFYRIMNVVGWGLVIYRWAVLVPTKAPAGATAWLLRTALHGYPKARSFILTHAGGFVGGAEHAHRTATCANCAMLRRKPIPRRWWRIRRVHESCKAESCGCPDWTPADLRWKRWLAVWRCPKGMFGLLGPAPE